MKTAFPDLHLEIQQVISDGRKVARVCTMRGTHQGEFRGILASGQVIAVRRIDTFIVEEDRIYPFVVAPRRWVVERTLAILGRARRLSKVYEHEELHSEAMIYLASIGSLLRRLSPNTMTATRYRKGVAAA